MAINKILLIEPSAIVSNGIKALLANNTSFKISVAVSDFSQCAERLCVMRPDIVLVNPSVFDYRNRLSVRSLSPHLKDTTLVAIAYGLLEDDIMRQYNGVINIYDSAAQIIKKINNAIKQNQSSPVASDGEELSEREREILTAVARGMTNKEIADLHMISVYTVISHRKNITRKIGIKTVSGLTVYALLNNLLTTSDIE